MPGTTSATPTTYSRTIQQQSVATATPSSCIATLVCASTKQLSLDALGDSLSAIGDSQAAHHAWTQARDSLEELRHAHAERHPQKSSPQ